LSRVRGSTRTHGSQGAGARQRAPATRPATAFYDALDTAGSTPLRLVLLDEAFERVDDPTKTRLLKLLASLDIDWVITWPGGSVLSSQIGLMHIYNIFRPAAAPGMAFVHLTWDGIEAKDE